MLAVNEPNRIYVNQPSGTRVQRQISRMIKHLRDQYHRDHPTITMPSSWLIGELVINGAKLYVQEYDSWIDRIELTLKQIIRDTSYDDCLYINSRNNLPLFPNNDLFDPWEVNKAMCQLLDYLDDLGGGVH
ncbi:MAG: hypothetical protein AAFZ92_07205 [Pseudomonadota bacterium]